MNLTSTWVRIRWNFDFLKFWISLSLSLSLPLSSLLLFWLHGTARSAASADLLLACSLANTCNCFIRWVLILSQTSSRINPESDVRCTGRQHLQLWMVHSHTHQHMFHLVCAGWTNGNIFQPSKACCNRSCIFWWNKDVAFTHWKHTNFCVGCLRRRRKIWFSSHFWVSISSSFRKLFSTTF